MIDTLADQIEAMRALLQNDNAAPAETIQPRGEVAMMKLTDQLEALRVKLADEHANSITLLDTLDARMKANDATVMRRLATILNDDAQRKGEIFELAHRVAARIGSIPSPRIERPTPIQAEPQRQVSQQQPQPLHPVAANAR